MTFPKKVQIELTTYGVDPDLLKILFGGYQPNGMHRGLTIYAPIRRTFWQWLRRRPIQQRVVHYPNVVFTEVDD